MLSLLSALMVAPLCLAHMQMTKPYPFRSPFDPANDYTNIDYSMNAPLEQDGSNYPCKGYNSLFDQTPAKDTLTAGQKYSITIGGTAPHNGGSCQVSLSYDNGQNFAVIHSIMGGCPLTDEYEFMVPEGTPSAEKVLLSWSWINHTGNREFYQNCSPVKVVNSNANAELRAPTMFRANSFPDNSCISPEGLDVVFPNPGASIVYGGAYAGNPPTEVTQLPNCNYNQIRTVVINSSGASSVQDGITEGDVSDNVPTPTSSPEEEPQVTSATISNSITEEDSFTTIDAEEILSNPGKVVLTTSVHESSTVQHFTTSRRSRTSDEGSYQTPVPEAPQPEAPQPNPETPQDQPEGEAPEEGQPQETQYTEDWAAPSPTENVGEAPQAPQETEAVPTTAPVYDGPPAPQSTSPEQPGGCTNNALKCTGAGYTFESCWDNRWIAMGPVAAGTICRNGEIAMDFPEENCTDSAIKCTSTTTWSLCSNNSYIPMGNIADGTQCLDGKIVAAPAAGDHFRKRRLGRIIRNAHGRSRS